MMRIISIANQKGGCGKTTSAINLSACLAHNGRKVLLMDMDPQGHSAIGLNINTGELEKTVCDTLCHSNGAQTVLDDVIIEVNGNLDMAPSNISLSTLEQHLSMVHGRETKLKHAIDGLTQSYDYIIIDYDQKARGFTDYMALTKEVMAEDKILEENITIFIHKGADHGTHR
jgi:chromosome partitioning protein